MRLLTSGILAILLLAATCAAQPASAPAEDTALPAAADEAPAAVEPSAAPPAAPGARSATTATAEPGRRAPVSEFTQPESMLFMLMRTLAVTPGAGDSYNIRREIEQWRAAAHDRKRKVGARWVAPDDFTTRRRACIANIDAARAAYTAAKRTKGKTPKEQAVQDLAVKKAAGDLPKAALDWPDPLLRYYLVGLADLQAEDYRAAEEMLRRARQQAPYVAAFAQAHGLALMKIERETDALEAFTAALRLRPDSRQALQDLRDAMQATPGGKLKDPAYVAATNLVEHYKKSGDRAAASKQKMWLMPGAEVRADEFGLPCPAYDRLVVRQAGGVPVGEHMLMVDAAAVEGALDVLVRIDDKTLVPGVVQRGRVGKDAPAVNMAMVAVSDYTFTPLQAVGESELAAGSSVTIFGVNSLQEMGGGARRIPAKITRVKEGGELEFSGGLAPGEAAGVVLALSGRLAGVAAGKTDIAADDGGGKDFATAGQFKDALAQAARTKAPSLRSEREFTPRPADGQCFVVLGIFGETLHE